jgi:hypothetical protein
MSDRHKSPKQEVRTTMPQTVRRIVSKMAKMQVTCPAGIRSPNFHNKRKIPDHQRALIAI